MDVKKDEMTEIIANEISAENISGTQESDSDIEVMTETTEYAAKYISAATADGASSASDAAVSAPAVDNPSRTDTTETASTSARADWAVTDSTDAHTTAAAPAENNLTAVDPTAADPVAAAPAENNLVAADPATPKNEGKKMRLWGILELTAAALIFVFSVYLFLNTRGTKLLFVSVTFGRICRYYWIGLLTAIILGLVGWVTLRRHTRTVPKTDDKEDK